MLAGSDSLQNASAEGDTRTLSFHHVHTDENITVTFKRNGRYDDAALKKLDWFMRDWRKEQETHMDPHLFDLMWEVYRETGATQPIDVICGFRSPATNAMLRARSTGVAQFSQHINGQAIDFFIPGVPLDKIRAAGLRMQRGGVGFYPTSGSPFVHMDTGTIRHWPRIAREELVKIFPDGRTVHIPADGHPLPGYALALADVERQGHVPSATSLETAREAGVINEREEQVAERPKRNIFARLFGIGKDEDERSEAPPSAPAPRHTRASVAVASITPPKHVATERIAPALRPKPAAVAAVNPQPAAQTYATASLPDNVVFDARLSNKVETRPLAPGNASPFELASVDSTPTGSTVLAYATEAERPVATRARPMGSNLPKLPVEAKPIAAPSVPAAMVKPPATAAMSIGGQRADSPWMRAAMLTPSVSRFMTATRIGPIDMRWLSSLMDKPSASLAMTFSADPHLGLFAEQFTGEAVVFLATANFAPQTTASLR